MNNVDLGIWGKLTRGVIFLLLLAGVLLVFLSYLPLIRQNERYRQQIQLLDAQIQKVDAANRQLQSEINALRNDSQAIELLAREKLGYARPDETVIRFEESSTNRATRH